MTDTLQFFARVLPGLIILAFLALLVVQFIRLGKLSARCVEANRRITDSLEKVATALEKR